MDALKRHRRKVERNLRRLERESRRLDAKLRLLRATDLPGSVRDGEPPHMLQPGARGEVTTLRDDLVADADPFRASGPLLAEESGPRARPAPWANYGVLHYGAGRSMRVQRGPISMLSRRHDRPLIRDDRSDRVARNRALFFFLLAGMAILVAVRLWLW